MKNRKDSDSPVMKKRSGWGVCLLPLYLFTLLFVLGPIIYMVVISFSTNNADGYGFKLIFTLDNYKKILSPLYLKSFGKSFELAIFTTVFTVMIGYPFGYFMAKLSEKGKKIMMFFIMVPFWVSSLLRLYGWIIMLQGKGIINRVLLFLGLVKEPVKILYTYPAVVIGMVYALLPFMILSVYSSVEKMDWSYVEAARDMGAGAARAFWDITLKMTLPGLLSGVILTFVPSMGLFFVADLLGGNKIVLVGNLIQDQLTRGSNWPFAAALAVILTIMMIVMIVLYRKITNVKDLEEIFG